MRYFTTQGIILKKQNSGENDYFLTIFSPEFGRIQALSRSSRKSTSQKGNHLDTLNLCSFQFYKNGSRYLLTECRVEKGYSELKSNLEKSLCAQTFSEIIGKSIQENQENLELFKLFYQTLNQLEQATNHQLILEEFKIKTLKLSGTWPDISICHFCQTKWTSSDLIYTDIHGQLTCQNCLTFNVNQLYQTDFNTIKLANFLAENDTSQISLHITPEQLFNLQRITTIFLHNYLNYELRTEKLLN